MSQDGSLDYIVVDEIVGFDAAPGTEGIADLERTEEDILLEERNTLGQALRRIAAGENHPNAIAVLALDDVFPGDPLGEKGLYDCPDAAGNIREIDPFS